MQKYSLTMSGIIVAVALPLLGKVGFTDICSNEILDVALPLIGGAIAWFGRVRVGDVSMWGIRK